MRVSAAFPSNYIKASDLQGREVQVRIARIAMEDVGDDHKPIVYFNGKEKGLVLNKTNANNIALMYGDETDAWIGQIITLFTAWVDFQGKSVEAIRVKPTRTNGSAAPAQHPNAPPGPPSANPWGQSMAPPPPPAAIPGGPPAQFTNRGAPAGYVAGGGGSTATDLSDEIPFIRSDLLP